MLLGLLAEAGAAFAILYLFLAGWRRDFRVPLYFSYDALEYLMQVKGTVENGWWWVHPRLSAPGVFEQIQYPSNTSVDQAIVWIVHLFTSEPGLVINVSWMIMVVLTALVASRCLVLLGLRRRVAIPVGLLYALSPYALSRHIDHFSLATYLVPIPGTVALLAATGRLEALQRPQTRALIAGCALVGFNYTYYAFFACFLLLVASLIGLASGWSRRELGRGLAFVVVICLSTAINLAPSLYSWAGAGKPVAIPEKQAAEAEQYGLKIRQLVSPVREHAFLPFQRWMVLEKDADYPLETENSSARLGLLGTAGFLTLLCGFFAPRIAAALPDGPLFVNAGRLTLAALLLATVGGFGSLFNLLVSPEIRAYNRLAPFISFFALVAVGLIVERLLRPRPVASTAAPWVPALLVAVLFIGLYDQKQATNSLNAEHEDIRDEWMAVSSFVRSLEARLPAGATVFQLPVLTYLTETGRERMLTHDHIKPYVVSSRLHWSFPALSNPIVRWQQQVGRLPAPVLATALAGEGFAAILIDRHGYSDRGQSLLSELGVSTSSAAVLAENDRYVALDVSAVRKADVPIDRLPHLGATVTAATTRVPECGTATAYNLERIGGSSAPFVGPPVTVNASSAFSVAGWAVDEPNGGTAGDVDILIGDTALPASYGADRPDVAGYLGLPAYRGSGFIVRLAGDEIGSGIHHLSLRILAADRSCYYQSSAISIVVR